MATHPTLSDRDHDGPGSGDPALAVKTKPKTKRPPMYKVLLLNDDYTPM
ncbi:MAG: ATP-dependent Clp protease adaptor ClpS, partial [Rhodobacteraceae bacterium]|nr:ATP-dependent Clp protease adaptor ClpS [Paracoccaceae bacterium]